MNQDKLIDGNFWTPAFPGDTAYVEVRGVLIRPQFEIAEVAHVTELSSEMQSLQYPNNPGAATEGGLTGRPGEW